MSEQPISHEQYEKNVKSVLITVLKDLSENGAKDPEAMWLIGSLATKLITDAKAKDWLELKARISPKGYDVTLGELQKQGHDLQVKGKVKAAYAMQAIAVSLAAQRMNDKDTKKGNELLNQLISDAISYFNNVNAKSKAN